MIIAYASGCLLNALVQLIPHLQLFQGAYSLSIYPSEISAAYH